MLLKLEFFNELLKGKENELFLKFFDVVKLTLLIRFFSDDFFLLKLIFVSVFSEFFLFFNFLIFLF